ncbi:MAG: cation transporter [Peptococcaceae bacterium]|jgi:copper chaperone CopZ|nr:cation transporter [Peptococcaceae bacterium]
MKKVFKMEDLDCANCAAKMEDAIGRLNGVKSVRINFISQKFTLDASDDLFEGVLTEAKKIVKKIEPDCAILA